MSNFSFLAAEFSAVHDAAAEAERQAGVSPTAAAFFAGKAVEVAVKWAFRADPNLKLPYQDKISALLHEPSFRQAAGEAVFAKAQLDQHARQPGRARGDGRLARATAPAAVASCSTSASGSRAPTRAGEAHRWPRLRSLACWPPRPMCWSRRRSNCRRSQADARRQERADSRGCWPTRSARRGTARRCAPRSRRRSEPADAQPDDHDYSEAETRDLFIDLLLREAGWPLDRAARPRVPGRPACPTTTGEGFVDYVLWGDDGMPLGRGRGQAHHARRRESASSRPSCTPTAWSSSSASGR